MLVDADCLEAEGSALKELIDAVGGLLVHAYDLAHRRRVEYLPERRLAAAVLHEAIDDLHRSIPSRVCEAWAWIADRRESDHLYAFANICTLMGINTAQARTILWKRFAPQVRDARRRRDGVPAATPLRPVVALPVERMRWRHRSQHVKGA